MVTQIPSFAQIRERRSAPISHCAGSTAFSAFGRGHFFRKRRRLNLLSAICAFAAVTACVSVADAHVHKTSHHVHKARYHARHASKVKFDGRWSVVIDTKRGTCDSYRVGLDIVNGTVTFAGSPYGRVSAAGVVRVSGTMGSQHGRGTGRLSQTSGQGVWQAHLDTGICDGRWTAERYD